MAGNVLGLAKYGNSSLSSPEQMLIEKQPFPAVSPAFGDAAFGESIRV